MLSSGFTCTALVKRSSTLRMRSSSEGRNTVSQSVTMAAAAQPAMITHFFIVETLTREASASSRGQLDAERGAALIGRVRDERDGSRMRRDDATCEREPESRASRARRDERLEDGARDVLRHARPVVT